MYQIFQLSVHNRTFWDFMRFVLTPTFIGGAIYVLFRSPDLLVFDWIEAVGLLDLTMTLRGYVSHIQLPQWFLYSAPDGIWVFAVTSWMILIWHRRTPFYWLIIGALLGIGGEIGQAIGLVSGTYQHLDIFFYFAGFLLAYLHLSFCHE